MLGSPLKTVFEFSCYFAIIFVITIGWFSLVAKFFANSLFQGYFQDKHKYIQFISGVSMYYFGSKVVIGF